MKEVVVVIGAGQIGQAIARRIGAGKHVVLADIRRENADAAAEVLAGTGFEVATAVVDVSSRTSVHALVDTVDWPGFGGDSRALNSRHRGVRMRSVVGGLNFSRGAICEL